MILKEKFVLTTALEIYGKNQHKFKFRCRIEGKGQRWLLLTNAALNIREILQSKNLILEINGKMVEWEKYPIREYWSDIYGKENRKFLGSCTDYSQSEKHETI